MEATATRDEIERFTLRESQVLMTKDSESADDIGVPAYVPHDMPGVICGYHLTQISPGSKLSGQFLHWSLASRKLRSWFEISARGVTRFALDQDAIQNAPIPFPPLPTQHKIADFLDRETERIDALVDKKRRLIDLLEEKRTATITQAVTKGLDPTVPMKDSTIPWIGQIPAHWENSRLKSSITSLVDTEHKTVHFVDDGDYPVIRTSDVRSGQLLLDDARRTDTAGYREWTRRRRPRVGDVMLAREAPAGEACQVPESPSVCLGQRMVLITPDSERLLDKYLIYSIYSDAVQIFIELASQGATVTHLNMADIPELPIGLPRLAEQREIVSYLDSQAGRLQKLGAAIASQLTLLAEYQEALITAAVTGEIDVDTFDNDRHIEGAAS